MIWRGRQDFQEYLTILTTTFVLRSILGFRQDHSRKEIFDQFKFSIKGTPITQSLTVQIQQKKSRIRETLNLSTDADHRICGFFLVELRFFLEGRDLKEKKKKGGWGKKNILKWLS